MSSANHPDWCANLNREQILKKLRMETLKNVGLQRAVDSYKQKVKKYESATKISVGARGGWWTVRTRPTGPGSPKHAGNYIRDPFNNPVISDKIPF